MKKRVIFTLLLVAAALTHVSAQSGTDAESSLKPRKGDWQVSLMLGKGQFFGSENLSFALPTWDGSGAMNDVGINREVSTVLKLGGAGTLNGNSLLNMAGVQFSYFVTDAWEINLSGAMDLNFSPSKDYEEGVVIDADEPQLNTPNSRYIMGNVTDNWMVDVGANYHFTTRSGRVGIYVGAVAGFRMGTVQQKLPYTGITIEPSSPDEDPDPLELYFPSVSGATLTGMKFGAVAGVECVLVKGLVLGLEINPVTYCYSTLSISPKLTGRYRTSYSNVRAFSSPTLKLGFRF